VNHRFDIGEVLKQTFSVYFANFSAFVAICTLVLIPSVLTQIWVTLQQIEDPFSVPWGGLLLMALNFLLVPLATAALTYGVFQYVRGRKATIAECLSQGLKRLFPVIGVSFLVGVITVFALLLLVVPGIIAAVVLSAAVPAAVIERPGVTGALSRSAELTKGDRWPVFGVLFLLFVLSFIVGFPVGMLQLVSLPLYLVGAVLIQIVFTGLRATSGTLIYYHLRKAKEAIDVEDIAAVFD
jgi:hypothetical protein